jgi:DNA-binding beta-propeller fold protein YncE
VSPLRGLSTLSVVGAIGLSGCTEGATTSGRTQETGAYADYDGVAFPNRRPNLVVPPDGLALVVDGRADTITPVALAGPASPASPVGRDPVGTDGPSAVAADLERSAVYVALSYPASNGGLHAREHAHGPQPGYVQKLSLDDLSVLGEVIIDAEPNDIALSRDGKRLVVAHRYDAGLAGVVGHPEGLDLARARLSIVDPATIAPILSPERKSVPLCVAPRAVVLSIPDGRRAFVSCFGEDAIAIADTTNPSTVAKIVPVGPDTGPPGAPAYGPTAVALSPAGTTMALANDVSREVRFLDLSSEAVDIAKTIALVGTPVSLAYSPRGGHLYVAKRNPAALERVDLATGRTSTERAFAPGECDDAAAVRTSAQGRLVLLCRDSEASTGRLLTLNATTLATVASTELGGAPAAVALIGGAP